MLRKYEKFRESLVLERALCESVLYLSPEMAAHLSKVGGEIAKDILDQVGKDIKLDSTFLDMSEKEGEITFATMRNAKRKLEEIYPNDPEFVQSLEDPSKKSGIRREMGYAEWAKAAVQVIKAQHPEFWKASRNPIKIGRLVRQIFPGKYTDSQIEEFVNRFKGTSKSDKDLFELVSGDAIAYWYDKNNYKEIKGTLGDSCMAGKDKGIFEIYTKNPEVCRLLILKDKENPEKIIGRALVWKLKENDLDSKIEYFMDRVYTISDSDAIRFANYAKANGWAYKTHNNHYTQSQITFGESKLSAKMSVKLSPASDKSYEYKQYPYMDTFKRYDPSSGVLHNDINEDEENEGQYMLQNTNGGWEEIESGVWSDYHDRTIPREDAVWSDPYGDWLDCSNAMYVNMGSNTGWYPEGDDNIVWSESEGENLHVDDCVWSDYESDWIYGPNSAIAVCRIEKDDDSLIGSVLIGCVDKGNRDFVQIDEDAIWFKILQEKSEFTSGEEIAYATMIKKSMCEEDKDGKLIPIDFAISTYAAKKPKKESLIEGIEGVPLTRKDARILGWKIDTDKYFVVDNFRYHMELNEIEVDAGDDFAGGALLNFLENAITNELLPNAEKEDQELYKNRLDEMEDFMPTDFMEEIEFFQKAKLNLPIKRKIRKK